MNYHFHPGVCALHTQQSLNRNVIMSQLMRTWLGNRCDNVDWRLEHFINALNKLKMFAELLSFGRALSGGEIGSINRWIKCANRQSRRWLECNLNLIFANSLIFAWLSFSSVTTIYAKLNARGESERHSRRRVHRAWQLKCPTRFACAYAFRLIVISIDISVAECFRINFSHKNRRTRSASEPRLDFVVNSESVYMCISVAHQSAKCIWPTARFLDAMGAQTQSFSRLESPTCVLSGWQLNSENCTRTHFIIYSHLALRVCEWPPIAWTTFARWLPARPCAFFHSIFAPSRFVRK